MAGIKFPELSLRMHPFGARENGYLPNRRVARYPLQPCGSLPRTVLIQDAHPKSPAQQATQPILHA